MDLPEAVARYTAGSKRDVFHGIRRAAFASLAVYTLLRLAAAPSGAAAPLPQYTLTDLGLLPTRTLDYAPGLNAAGEVSAWRETADNQFCATLIRNGHTADLVPLPGGTSAFASDINRTGVVVGLSQSPEDLRHTRAVAWHQGKAQDLGTSGGKYALANAVNDRGQAVGAAQTLSGAYHAALWQTDLSKSKTEGKTEDLGTLGTGDSSRATAINARGDIAGESSTVPGGKGHAFLRSSLRTSAQMRDLGLLPGGSFSSATALNDRRDIAGFADLPDGGFHAVLWRTGKTIQTIDLGTLGDEPSIALGINRRTQVVGTSAIREDALRAFLWQDGTMTDLNTLLSPNSGWLLLTAYKINDAGQILCRGSLHGQIHLCLLTPALKP